LPQISWDAPKKPDNLLQKIGLLPTNEQIANSKAESGPQDIGELPGQAFKGIGQMYSEAGPEQVATGAKSIYGANYKLGAHQLISGSLNTALPLAPEAIAAKPLLAARAALGGLAGNLLLTSSANVLQADPDTAALAGDIGGLAGGTLSAEAPALSRALAGKFP